MLTISAYRVCRLSTDRAAPNHRLSVFLTGDGKVCLPSFREWLAPLTRLPSVFVIVPLSSTIANAYNITPSKCYPDSSCASQAEIFPMSASPAPAPDSQRLRDTIKQPLSYFSRTIPIGTRYNFGPISSSKAPIECVREDRKRELRKPERDCWTKYIDDRQEANIAMAHLISRDRGFWAARKSQPWWP